MNEQEAREMYRHGFQKHAAEGLQDSEVQAMRTLNDELTRVAIEKQEAGK